MIIYLFIHIHSDVTEQRYGHDIFSLLAQSPYHFSFDLFQTWYDWYYMSIAEPV